MRTNVHFLLLTVVGTAGWTLGSAWQRDAEPRLQDGRLRNYKAEQGGECFKEMQAPYSGPKDVFAYFQIGRGRITLRSRPSSNARR